MNNHDIIRTEKKYIFMKQTFEKIEIEQETKLDITLNMTS